MKKILIVVGILLSGVVGIYALSNLSLGGENEGDIAVLGSEAENNEESKVSYQKISAEEARKMMGEAENFVLLDVRTEAEFREKHLDGAALIPDYEIKERVEATLLDKNVLILVYCRSGGRSAGAVHKMIEMGYKNVYDMGGIIDWPYEVVEENPAI